MKKIFGGFIFIYFEFPIVFDPFVINLIPDFVGYIFIVKGLTELSFESYHFDNARTPAIITGIYTFIEFFFACFGFSVFSINILSLIFTIISCVIFFYIIAGIGDIEDYYKVDLKSKLLKGLLITSIISEALLCISLLSATEIGKLPIVSIFLGGLAIISRIALLVLFYIESKNYEKIPKHVGPINNEQIQ